MSTPEVTRWTNDEIAAMPGWSLIQASHALARRFHAALRGLGLSPTEFGVLAELDANSQRSNAELARRVLTTPQSMGETVSSLLELGLVHREANTTRGRRINISLTDEGRQLLQQATPIIRELNAPVTLGLTKQEAIELNTLLHKVRNAAAHCHQPATPQE